MSWETHDDDCEGCKPALVDVKTGKVMSEDSPEMVAVLRVWGETTLPERQAWHRATCQGSRDPGDVRVAEGLASKITLELP